MYYAKLLADLLAIGMILFWIRAPRPRALLLAPWLLANVLTTFYTAGHISWLDWNAEDSRRYVSYMTQAFPPFSKCQPEHPCCLEGLQRIWGRNEWVLSYNLTQASRYPSFYPEGWPGARCERHYRLTIK
jgi:hypothetical protein